MNLNLYILQNDLAEYDFQGKITSAKTQARLVSPVFCVECPDTFREDVLYVIFAGDLPRQEDVKNNPSFLCIGLPKEDWQSSGCDLLYTVKPVVPAVLFNAVTERFFFYQEWENSLQEVIDKRLPLKEMAVRSFRLLRNPISLLNTEYALLFYYTTVPLPETVRSKMDGLLGENGAEKQMYLSNQAIQELLCNPSYAALESATEPCFLCDPASDFQGIFYNLIIEGVVVARVFVDEFFSSLRPGDYFLIKTLGKYIKKGISNEQISFIGRPSYIEELLNGLLTEKPIAEQEIRSVLSMLQWNENDAYVCLLITLQKNPSVNAMLTAVAANLCLDFQNSCHTILNEQLVFVCNLRKLGMSVEKLTELLLSSFNNRFLTCGVSKAYSDFKKLYYYYRQALFSITYGSKKEPSRNCYFFEDYQLPFILYKAMDHNTVETLIPDGLRKLLVYDQKRNTSYAGLLRCYLDHERNIAETARAAFLSRNTCIYQLQKIQKITDLNFDHPRVRLMLQIAFELLEESANGFNDFSK